MIEDSSIQRITRLLPLPDVLALIQNRVHAVLPRRHPLSDAGGRVLAEDIVIADMPAHAIALRDGFAVNAGAIADAGSYSPVPLAAQPDLVETGEQLPDGTDAVISIDAVQQRGDHAEAIAAASPGEGVLPVGGDVAGQNALRRSGEGLRALDIAILAAAGIADVLVREPRIRIVCGSAARTPAIDSMLALLARAVAASGVAVIGLDQMTLETALRQNDADAVFAVGGTGSGGRDASVRTLARIGDVTAHGIAVSPGETAAVGFIKERPVLLIPGRVDATLAIWLLIGRAIVTGLARAAAVETSAMMPLKRKVTSTIGLSELIPVRCAAGTADPLASGYLPLQSLAASDGWIFVPADSEGFAAGRSVAVRSWP